MNYKILLTFVIFKCISAGPAKWDKVGKRNYILSNQQANWFKANELCYKYGGKLAELNSYVKYTSVKEWIPNNGRTYWIGGSDINEEGEWRWTFSGENVQAVYWYNNEGMTEPNGKRKENCLNMYNEYLDRTYNDLSCLSERYFICEKYESP